MRHFINPISNDGNRPDPFVLRHNGRYYLYCTHPNLLCYVSDNLLDWQEVGPVIEKGTFGDLVPFAPEVVYINGTFYLYTSPSGEGHQVLSASDPTGPFTLLASNLPMSLDASPFVDHDGTLYLYWADDRGIFGCQMKNPTHMGKPILVCPTEFGWSEGPQVIFEDGRYYMTLCGTHFLNPGYRMYLAVATNPLGPFELVDPKPLLIHTEEGYVGLGHNSIVWGPDLLTRYLVYHSLNDDNSRDMNITPVHFSNASAEVAFAKREQQQAPLLPITLNSWEAWEDFENIKETQRTVPFRIPARAQLTTKNEYSLEEAVIESSFIVSGGSPSVLIGALQIEFVSESNLRVIDRQSNKVIPILLAYKLRCSILHTLVLRITGESVQLELDGVFVGLFTTTPQLSGKLAWQAGTRELTLLHTQYAKGSSLGEFEKIPRILPYDGKVSKSVYISNSKKQQVLVHVYTEDNSTGELILSFDGQNQNIPYSAEGVAVTLREGVTQISTKPPLPIPRVVVHQLEESSNVSTHVTSNESFKIHPLGANTMSNYELKVRVRRNQMGPEGYFGVTFRMNHLSEGGEGNDPAWGINNFVGYSFTIEANRLVLSKHQYDKQVLLAAPSELILAQEINFSVRIIGNDIAVFLGTSSVPVLEYSDPDPIYFGQGGIIHSCALIVYADVTIECFDHMGGNEYGDS